MKSIKPGRGPSAMNALGSLFGVVFGIFWTAIAVISGAPFFFPIFGVFFVIMGLVQFFYSLHNATSENRFSEYDITENGEEKDPWDKNFRKDAQRGENSGGFCPYCGQETEAGYEFCPK